MPTLQDKYADLISAAKASGASNLAVRAQDNVLYIDGVVPTGEAKDKLWNIYDKIDQRETLSVALRALTPQQRAAVILTTMLGFRSEEAGRMLGIKDSTVRVLANRARAHLRTTVEDTR